MSAATANAEMMAAAIKTETILFAGIAGSDSHSLDKIFLDSEWQPHGTSNCQEALGFLAQHRVSVVLAEPELRDGSWRDLLHGMASRTAPPSLIVSSRLADGRLWAEVLNLGGFDVLMTPFEAKEVLWVTSSARRHWECSSSGRAAGESRAGQSRTPMATAARPASPEFHAGAQRMFNTRPRRSTEFKEGDNVVLAQGTCQGTLGVFIRLRQDLNWAEVRERSGAMRDHPVVWLQHAGSRGNTVS